MPSGTKLKAPDILKLYRQKSEEYWVSLQRKNTLLLYWEMVKKVPAYVKFLKQNNFDPDKIANHEDLSLVPATTKKNYFQRFPISEVAWQDHYKTTPFVFTSTSGSTGEPTYFLRDENLDWQYSVLAEMFIRNGRKGTTLLIDCFGMGVWIGGLITYQAFRNCALRGFPLTIITPGVNKMEIFHSLKNAAPYFENVILAGYPPFIKDVVDEARSEGIKFPKHVRLFFAAESFTENFRDYLGKELKLRNVYVDTLNIYGTAELGAMAFETPGAILIRRLALKYSQVYQEIFSNEKLPTLAQYNPMFVNFEVDDNNVLISANSAMPLFRYKIGDNGGVLRLSQIEAAFAKQHLNLRNEARKLGIELFNLPFVYVYERSDFSTKLYGAIIYPEPIKEALLDRRIRKHVSGKFTMITKFDAKQNEYLEINIETMPKFKSNLTHHKLCQKLIVENLIKKNAEYKNNYDSIPHKVTPKIVFWSYGHPIHFAGGGKHKWTKS
jgi:phenylacetate-CoA ligase